MLRLKSELFFDKKKSKETKSKVSLDFSMFFFSKIFKLLYELRQK